MKETWEKRDEDPNLIPCIGKDNKQHVCYPWEDICYCGEPVIRKKLLRDDWNLDSCYECTF